MTLKNEVRFPSRIRAVRHLKAVDPKLAWVIEQVGPCTLTLDLNETLYESLGISIIYQQLHGKAAAAITERLKRLHSKTGGFPSAKKILGTDLQALQSVGLSESKAKSLYDLAEKTISKSIPNRNQAEEMDDDALIESLTSVRGIGPWTAQMMLMFTLGRPDVLPLGDYGVRKGFALLYGKKKLPTPKELDAAGEKWKPFRSIASWYLWRVTEMEIYRGRKFE